MDKTVAVLDFTDGILTGVLGSPFTFSIDKANELADSLGQRKAQIDAQKMEYEQAAAKAARLVERLQEEEPTFQKDVRDFQLLLNSLRERTIAQGGAFPDDRFEKYI